jgi:hypothetical protein
MRLDGFLVIKDPAVIKKIVGDLNALEPIPGTGNVVGSCPNDSGHSYTIEFTYSNGDKWTVEVNRLGCHEVTAGGFWPRTVASANSQLKLDLDAVIAGHISA